MILGGDELHNNLVYPSLHRFEVKGWVRRRAISCTRGQRRHVYALTAGRNELVPRLSDDSPVASSRDEFCLRVAFLSFLSSSVREQVLAAREDGLRREIAHFETIREKLGGLGLYPDEAVRFLQDASEAEASWVRRLRQIETSGAAKRGRRLDSGSSQRKQREAR